VKEEDEELWF
jgi:hypothetical protein